MRLLLLAFVAAGAADPSPSSLERLLTAASDDAFYLVLDNQAKALSLRLREVVLLERQASEVELALPRLAFRRASGETAVVDRAWAGGRLWPPRPDRRVEVVPGQPPAGGVEPDLQTCFDVRFEGGLTLEVRSLDGCPIRTGIALRWASLRQLWAWSGGGLRTRLRVVVPDAVARELREAIPDGVRLVVLA